MSRLLILDYGSHSLRWLVADQSEGCPLGPVESGGRTTRLGQPGESGGVAAEAVEKTLAATEKAFGRAGELGVDSTIAVATHFARSLAGAGELSERLKSRWGVRLMLLSGEEEAWLTRVGVEEGLACLGLDGTRFLAVDVGGGSTELSWWELERREGRELFTRSVPVGAISLLGEFLHADPPAPEERERLAAKVGTVLGEPPLPRGLPVAASGGTATALAALHLGLREYIPAAIQGTRLERGVLSGLIGRLAAVPLAERRLLLPADEERAEVIVAGALVLETLLNHLGSDGLLVSDYDLKHGAAIVFGGRASPVPRDARD